MDAVTNEGPDPKRARLASACINDLLTALPDAAIHRVFDFLTEVSRKFGSNDPGVANDFRAALARTCRRLNRFYRHQYVTVYSREVDFAKEGNILEYFPRLDTIRRFNLECHIE
mmetsp:Transcript_7379/g.18106  ORF Transcript_7379/g.18106 Transcript_7379/m.18106 type:complete len:114 (-) Transcript_7379:896-1237(-)